MENSIHCGDCLPWLQTLPGSSVDACITDMPYGTTACAWDTVVDLPAWWREIRRVVAPGGAIVSTAQQPFTTTLINSNFVGFCYTWVWHKHFGANFVQAKRMPLRVHEDILVFSADGKMPRYFPQMEARDKPITKGGNRQSAAIPVRQTSAAVAFGLAKKQYDDKHPTTLVSVSSREDRGAHPTQKPVALFEYLVKTYVPEGGIVLDPFMGSGTTALAALRTGRRWIGAEKHAEYVALAEARLMKEMLGGVA